MLPLVADSPGHRLLQLGQHFMLSPPRHTFWLALIAGLVNEYDPSCYPPDNTGPGGVTVVTNTLCASFNVSAFHGAASAVR